METVAFNVGLSDGLREWAMDEANALVFVAMVKVWTTALAIKPEITMGINQPAVNWKERGFEYQDHGHTMLFCGPSEWPKVYIIRKGNAVDFVLSSEKEKIKELLAIGK